MIRVEDIICLLAEQKYTTLRHIGGEELIEDSLRTLEEEFGTQLLRIHRSALVNRDFIAAVERNADGQHFIRLRGVEKALPVSRRLVGELKTRL